MTSNNLTKDDVSERADKLDFPESVIEFFQGYLGQPPGGFPEPLRSKIIRDRPRIDTRPGLNMKPLDFKKIKSELREKFGKNITDVDVASYYMYPKVSRKGVPYGLSENSPANGFLCALDQVFEEFQGFLEKYGDLSVVPTRHFLGKPVINEEMNIEIEAGKLLIVKLLAVGKINENTGTRECFFEVNAETRVVVIEDRQAAVSKVSREKASSEPGSIGSPMVSRDCYWQSSSCCLAESSFPPIRPVWWSRSGSRRDPRSRPETPSACCPP